MNPDLDSMHMTGIEPAIAKANRAWTGSRYQLGPYAKGLDGTWTRILQLRKLLFYHWITKPWRPTQESNRGLRPYTEIMNCC